MLHGWALPKKGNRFYDFVDSALKIHKYLHHGDFLWVATGSGIILFFQEACQVASPGRASIKDPMQLNATMQCTAKCRRRDVVHTCYVTLFCCVKVTSRHDAWRMERDSFARSFDQTMT
jgi:hypothetical protein